MKAVVKYDLSDIDDELALNRALKSVDMALILFELRYNLRKKCENGVEIDKPMDIVDYVFTKIYDLMDNNNINIDELIR